MTQPQPRYYPPFGSSLPNRFWSDANRGYRFGFNGKEKDSETASDNYDFGARVYDGRLGRWLSLDPESVYYPGYSPYNFTVNNPIFYKDPDGNGVRVSFDKNIKDDKGRVIVKITAAIYVYTDVAEINNDISCHAKFVEKSIENNWNNPLIINPDGTTSKSIGNAEYISGDDKFVFVFDVNVIAVSKDEAKDIAAINMKTKDFSVNFIELRNGEGGSVAGGNTGYFPISNIDPNDEKVIAHEFGHLMGYIQEYNSNIALQIKNDVNSNTINGCLENFQHVNTEELGFSVSIMSSPISAACGENTFNTVKLDMSSTNVTTEDFTHLNFGQGLLGGIGIKNIPETGVQSPNSSQLDSKSKSEKTKTISWITGSTNKVE